MKSPDVPIDKKQKRDWLALLLIALFLVRVYSWATAELWYDEVLSLQLFILKHDTLAGLFRDYCIANNHFLANAIEWLWVRLCPIALGSELSLRIPAILCGIGTLLTVHIGWRKWLGKEVAFATALLLAASPVFSVFAFQMRGYSLAMLLSALALTAMMHRLEKNTWRNCLALFTASLALPLVMPSAAMLPAAIVAAFGLHSIFKGEQPSETTGKRILHGIHQSLPAIIGAFLGVLYYTTLWADFQRARAESGGWSSAWLVAGHLLLAFALHLAFFAWPLAKTSLSKRSCDLLPKCILGAVVIAAAAVLLVPSPVGRAPFPRVFLPLLPMLTLAAALAMKSTSPITAIPLKKLALISAIPGLLIGICCDSLTARQLDTRETPPQNLLQQYYRGNSPCSLNMSSLTNDSEKRLILVNASDVPAFSFYWQISGGNTIPAYHGLPPFIPGNIPSSFVQTAIDKHLEIAIFARTEAEARSILQTQSLDDHANLEEGKRTEHRTLYTLGDF